MSVEEEYWDSQKEEQKTWEKLFNKVHKIFNKTAMELEKAMDETDYDMAFFHVEYTLRFKLDDREFKLEKISPAIGEEEESSKEEKGIY